MLKYLIIALALSTSLIGATNVEVKKFLKNSIGKNPNIVKFKVDVLSRQKLDAPKGWEAVIVELDADAKMGGTVRAIKQKMIYFTKGKFITPDLIDIRNGKNLKETITPKFKNSYYNSKNLISGYANSKHKVVIFSDPLCPYCRQAVPEAINYMKKYPKEFAVYYYHLPLAALHPAAVTLVKAAIVAEQKGLKNVVLRLYKVETGANSKPQVALNAFNKLFRTKITLKDIKSSKVLKHYKHDENVAASLMVNGTPTFFFDGKKDRRKNLYKKVKIK
ncbi:MAG: thioredoxin domain-containing protein [Helicobacteraceae bacterium]|nr:thioredoxin domain-containing protein [Helicobacteraceae bacterium]